MAEEFLQKHYIAYVLISVQPLRGKKKLNLTYCSRGPEFSLPDSHYIYSRTVCPDIAEAKIFAVPACNNYSIYLPVSSSYISWNETYETFELTAQIKRAFRKI